MSVIAITHTAAEGTLVYGTARGDGSKDVLGPAGFRWYRSLDAWGIVGSRDRCPNVAKIEQAANGLRAAGFTVTTPFGRLRRPKPIWLLGGSLARKGCAPPPLAAIRTHSVPGMP